MVRAGEFAFRLSLGPAAHKCTLAVPLSRGAIAAKTSVQYWTAS